MYILLSICIHIHFCFLISKLKCTIFRSSNAFQQLSILSQQLQKVCSYRVTGFHCSLASKSIDHGTNYRPWNARVSRRLFDPRRSWEKSAKEKINERVCTTRGEYVTRRGKRMIGNKKEERWISFLAEWHVWPYWRVLCRPAVSYPSLIFVYFCMAGLKFFSRIRLLFVLFATVLCSRSSSSTVRRSLHNQAPRHIFPLFLSVENESGVERKIINLILILYSLADRSFDAGAAS